MAVAADGPDATLTPDDAFAALGNRTRIEILQALGSAGGPLSFSRLRERVGVRDSGQFNYHLDELTGHFIRSTEDGYVLRQAGARVVESVLSGAVTETPVIEPTPVDVPCHLCGGRMLMSYGEERVEMYCTECAGSFGADNRTGEWTAELDYGYLGYMPLPPAGIQGRSPERVMEAATIWANLEFMSMASNVCPRCSATMDYAVTVCEAHDVGDGLCRRCDRRRAVNFHFECTNCIYEGGGDLYLRLVANTDLHTFVAGHGMSPVDPEALWRLDRVLTGFEEEVVSVDPFEARVTFRVDGDWLTLTLGDDLTVSSTERGSAPA